MLNAIVKVAEELAAKDEIDEIVDLGDTLHSFKHVDQDCLRVAINWFRRLAAIRPLKILIGNHDRPSHNEFLTSRHPFHGIDNDDRITIVWRSYAEWCDDLAAYIVWMPYIQKGLHSEALNNLCDFKGNAITVSHEHIACEFSHGEYRGAIMEGHVSKSGDVWHYAFPNVSGHIHEHQYIGFHEQIDETSCNVGGIVYVGTPSQVAANESEYKTISLITIPPLTQGQKHMIHERRIAIPCTVIKTKIVTYDEMLTWSPQQEPKDLHGRNTVWRLIICDEVTKFSTLSVHPVYDKLRSLGVQLQTRPIPPKEITNNHTLAPDAAPTNSEREVSYIHSLYKRLASSEVHVRRLQRIIERNIGKK